MTNEKLYKPGDKAPVSGQYEVVGPRGGSKEREITMVEGKKFPATQSDNGEKYYKLVDKTKHKGK
ncbi:MAG TPA: hypothetical protein DCQ00_04115 [Phascolarctobacterium succinatutens]|jgi:hypothetical protein|uniref:YjzC family protein n=1 Tax=Phascolarctobacterium succinatutens TaxID=626940 RepID=UPI000ED9C003|nr:YjzC family protein [Phascolarctobacterium succinatutens]HAM92676.1 hypothetical protein [Phascolarctobacterium succinatutens]